MNTLNTPDPYGKRPYQEQAINTIVHHTTGLVQDRLMLDAANEDMSQKYPTAALLEMATGSGKTYTNGKILEKILNIRERYNRRYNTAHFQGLNILVLSNRIDGVNQFRDDLFHGKPGKNPILSEKLRRQSRIRTFHSKADNLDDIDPRYFTQDEADEYEDFTGGSSEMSDTFYFSTAQTAGLKSLDEKLPYIDMIIVDEAHNVLPGNDMDLILEKLTLRGRDGATPMILALTATPTNLTKELFGEAKYRFPLPEYLASGYAPDVRYHLVTATTASEDAISSLKAQVEIAKSCTDPMTKKELVRNIKKDFEDIMAKYPDMDSLVEDLLEKRIGTDPETVGQTIIFVNNTDEANEVAKTINQKYGTEVALSYHSYNDRKQSVTWSSDRKNGLERFAHAGDPIRIIVCVDKLNESVDVPTVENVVFWRGTDIEKVFLQQFGRGMRGNGIVNYYDYVGGLRNFAWMGDIQAEYKQIISSGGGGENGGRPSEFSLLGGNATGNDRLIDLSDIGFTIKTLSDETESVRCEPGEEIKIEEVVYVGVTNTNEVMGVKGERILYNAKKHPEVQILPGKQKNGANINLVPKSFVEGLLKTCEPEEEIKIGEVIYVGVTHNSENMGVKGRTILRNANKDTTVGIIQGRQKNGANINLVPKTFVEGLLKTCEPEEEIEIGKVIYVGVTQSSENMGVKGRTILRNANKDTTVGIIQGRQKNGANINLVPKSFVEGLLKTCEPEEEIKIGKVIYVGVTQNSENMGLKGNTILNNAKKNTTVGIIQGRQKNGANINLVPKSFVEGLLKTCEPEEEIKIGEVIYVGVTHNSENMGVKGETILNNAKKNTTVGIIQGRQKNGKNINLVPKSFIESLKVEHVCEPEEEIKIGEVIYLGVTQNSENMGVKGDTILKNAIKNSDIKVIPGKQKSGHNINLVPKSFIESLKSKQ